MHSNLVIAAGLAALFLFLAWRRGCGAGFRLASFTMRLVLFEIAFILGEVYLIVLIADLKWPRVLAFVGIAAWGALLVSGIGSRASRQRQGSDGTQK